MNKKTILQNWKWGDNQKVARAMYQLRKIEISGEAVRQWMSGETADSKLEPFYLEAAKHVQQTRVTAARATN